MESLIPENDKQKVVDLFVTEEEKLIVVFSHKIQLENQEIKTAEEIVEASFTDGVLAVLVGELTLRLFTVFGS